MERVYKIALAGNGPLAGKTTLGKYLSDEHGFILVQFNKLLVEAFVEHYNALGFRYSVDEVYKNKEYFRNDLIKHSHDIGFHDTNVGYWVERALSPWYAAPQGTSVVFDNVRMPGEVNYVRQIGFKVVKLVITEEEREYRAVLLGKSYPDLVDHMHRYPEMELGVNNPDIRLTETDLEKQVRIIMQEKPEFIH